MKLCVLVSGGGSNFKAIIEAIHSGQLPNVSIIQVIADRECEAINRAIDYNIPFQLIHRGAAFAEQLNQAIDPRTDLIVCAGFLSILPQSLIARFPNKIINIHPSLLPQFGGKGMYGIKVHEAVLKAKEARSGCTVHFVDNGVDTGQNLFQRQVEVFADDTPSSLQQRVLVQEHQLLSKAINYLNLLQQCHFPQAALQPDKPFSKAFGHLGLTDFQAACHYVKNLKYKKNEGHGDLVVLQEQGGSCTNKHILLQQLAQELGLNDIKLVMGIYRLTGSRHPRLRQILDRYGLDYILDHHTYFRVQDTVVDFTFSESFDYPFFDTLIGEEEYDSIEDLRWKEDKFYQAMTAFATQQNGQYSEAELLRIRQECSAALMDAINVEFAV